MRYLSVQYAYRSGEPLPKGQYMFAMVPHGLYPFAGACALDVDVSLNINIAVARLFGHNHFGQSGNTLSRFFQPHHSDPFFGNSIET